MKKKPDDRPAAKAGRTDPTGKKSKPEAEMPGNEENAAGKSNPQGKHDKYGSRPVDSKDIDRGE